MIEIERKFLVNSTAYRAEACSKNRIVQGFLNTHPERTVRVRIAGTEGFLTVKGKSSPDGTTRFEWERKIEVDEAEALLALCETGVLEKIRYIVPLGSHVFEVDEFLGENEGLVVAEIELQEERQPFKRPPWLGKEVTGMPEYYNSQLSKQPYKNWKK